MTYTIVGRYLSEGEETPHFDAKLCSLGVVLARIRNDGRGGECRVDWTDAAPRDGAVRSNAIVWLTTEAVRAWQRAEPGPIDPVIRKMFERPEDAAILAVSEHMK